MILLKHLQGLDLDELKRISPYLYTYAGEDIRTGVIIDAQADTKIPTFTLQAVLAEFQ